jgi:hypothetical protein
LGRRQAASAAARWVRCAAGGFLPAKERKGRKGIGLSVLVVQQGAEEACGGGDGGEVLFPGGFAGAGVELAAGLVEFLFVELAGAVEAAGADELDDVPELVAVEPDAVGAADVDDDAGAAGELDGGHQVGALRAGDVGALWGWVIAGNGDGRAEDGGLIFAVGADLLEGLGVDPDAAALRAIAEPDSFKVEVEVLEGDAAARAGEGGGCEG